MIIPRREYDRIKEALTKMEIDISSAVPNWAATFPKWNQMAHWTPFLLIRLYFIQGSNDNPTPSYIPDYQKIKNKKGLQTSGVYTMLRNL